MTMDEHSEHERPRLRLDAALDADADEADIDLDGAESAAGPVPEGEREPTAQEREKAIDALTRAEVVAESTATSVRDLMVRAYVHSGGVPARIVSAGGDSPPLPDLTRSAEGRAKLDRLDGFVRDGITEINRRGREGDGDSGGQDGDSGDS